jgi:hypothetical protein
VEKKISKIGSSYQNNKGGKTMRIIKAFTILAVMGIFSVMLLIITTPLVYGSGGAGEPGELCGYAPEEYTCGYLQPKYTGTIAGRWEEGNIYIYTPCPLYQLGKSAIGDSDCCFKCYIYIPDDGSFYIASETLPSKAKDLKGLCDYSTVWQFVGFCGGVTDVYEIVQASNLKMVSDNEFTFHAVIRPVYCEIKQQP